MKTAICIAMVGLASGTTLVGRQAATAPPTFDVVSIRPSPPGPPPGRSLNVIPGRVEYRGTTLKTLIGAAYARFPFDPREVVGGPSWIDSDRFDVTATTARPPQIDASGMPTELFAMIRALVEDRFRVRTHNERREADVYALVFARSDKRIGAGLRMVPDVCGAAIKEIVEGKAASRRGGPPPCSFGGGPGKLIATGVTMQMFANNLSGNVGRLVIDRTGLSGSIDIELTFDPSSAAKPPPGTSPGPPARDDTARRSLPRCRNSWG